MKKFLILFLVMFSLSPFAKGGGSFGGSRSSGSSSFRSSGSSSSRAGGGSFFGGSRSSGSNVTISRPAPPPSGNSSGGSSGGSTVVHNYGNSGGGGSGPGFWTGLMMGHVMSQPNTTVVVPGQGALAGPVVQAPVVVEEGHGAFFYLFWFFCVALIIGAFIWASGIL